ncbi:MAG: flavin monoamine oxidase family protein [Bryobacteraceae bacterium]
MEKLDCDVLIVGAGIAGLTAFADLAGKGVRVLCLEARDRIGGRILTVNDPGSSLPIELGPEFIHGRPPETWSLVRDSHLAVYECEERSVHLRNGKVDSSTDAWEQIDEVTEEMKQVAKNGVDRSFFDFIQGVEQPQAVKDLAISYVEGFNAAHKEIISVASLAQDAEAAEKIDGDRNFRFANGYHQIAHALLQRSQNNNARMRLNAVATRITWKPGHAQIEARSTLTDSGTEVKARRVIITLPLGVLRSPDSSAANIKFDPIPTEIMTALESLECGNVTRLVFRFKEAWWEEQHELSDTGFWLSNEKYFPTWWTTLPMRTPLLTAWSAGPHTDELLGQPKSLIVSRALGDLSRITGAVRSRLEEQLEAVHYHDWHSDPFSRGAYSYVRAGALRKRSPLEAAVEQTLFFAGEATELNGHGGTVHGARATGARAARQVLESLG